MSASEASTKNDQIPKGYKQTEVGVIPEDWEVTPFDELFEFRNGVNADKAAYGQGVRFINVLEPITFSHIHGPEITGQVTLPESAVASYAVRRGDVLFNRTSETQEEVALAATYLGTERVVFGGFVIRGRPIDERLDPVYSGYALRAPCVRSQIIPLGQGAVRANVSQQNLGLVVVPVPPPTEQFAIAQVLSDVDALLGALDRLIAKKRDLKQAAMQQLLTGQTRLPGFDGGWEVKTMDSLTSLMTNGFVGTATSAYVSGDEGVLYIQGYNVHEGAFDFHGIKRVSRSFHSRNQKSCLQEGDLLTIQTGDIGVTTVVPAELAGANCHALVISRFKKQSSSPHFYCHYFNSERGRAKFKEIETGSTMKHLNVGDMKQLHLPSPPIEEQIAIAAVLTDMDAELAGLEQRREKIRVLKQGMMQELLTGRTRLICEIVTDGLREAKVQRP